MPAIERFIPSWGSWMGKPDRSVEFESIASKLHTAGLLLIIVAFALSSGLLLSDQSTEALQSLETRESTASLSPVSG